MPCTILEHRQPPMASFRAPLLNDAEMFDQEDINRENKVSNQLFFVFVVLMLSADFWTVKNITGRLLVGLRWWNYVDDKGVSNWIFETKCQNSFNFNYADKQIFWITLIACPIVWMGFFVIALFGLKFKWMVSNFLNLISLLSFLYTGIPRCTSHSIYAISLYQGLQERGQIM
uniref:Golgi apparatus membrane protein TVP23 homolog n=1 Tax=Anopheles merus TaxID=30066 RepID=A0A182V9V5_ANOME